MGRSATEKDLYFMEQQPPICQGLLFTRFLDHKQRRTTVGRNPLDEVSARRRDLYLATRSTATTGMPPTGFEPTIPVSEWP